MWIAVRALPAALPAARTRCPALAGAERCSSAAPSTVMCEMTPASLKQICKEHKLYTTPSLNDVLYGKAACMLQHQWSSACADSVPVAAANYKGFGSIANLEPYSGLKALFLEGNALDSLAGLPTLKDLKCL